MSEFTRGPCEDLAISAAEPDSLIDLQQKMVAGWVLANTSRCSWERFLQGLGCPLNTIILEGTYDPVVFGEALTDAIFNESAIATLLAQLNSRGPEAETPGAGEPKENG